MDLILTFMAGIVFGVFGKYFPSWLNQILPKVVGCTFLSWHLPLINVTNSSLIKGFPPNMTSSYSFAEGECPRCGKTTIRRTHTNYGRVVKEVS